MSHHRRSGSRDQNHLAILGALGAVGLVTVDVWQVGGGVPDALVFDPGTGRCTLVEIKRPGPPSARKLTDAETRWHRWALARGLPVIVAQSAQEVIDCLRPRAVQAKETTTP